MSAINGDKARFHRQRKARIAKRARNHKFFKVLHEQPKASTRKQSPEKSPVAA